MEDVSIGNFGITENFVVPLFPGAPYHDDDEETLWLPLVAPPVESCMDRDKNNMRKTKNNGQFIPDFLRGIALEKHVVLGFLRRFAHRTSTRPVPVPFPQIFPSQILIVEDQPREENHFERASRLPEDWRI